MARPLKYDDQFRNIISSNLYSHFLFCIKLKVPSTTFWGKSNLQKGLRVLGIVDIVFCLLFLLFRKRYLHLAFIERISYYSTGLFGLIALDASKNLKKLNSLLYYYWRIIMMLVIPFYELRDYVYLSECYFLSNYCHWILFSGITLGYIGISLYLTKIAWTFAIQMKNGNELLILHGKYLEQMLKDENMKIEQKNIYIPPSQIMTNSNNNNIKESKGFNYKPDINNAFDNNQMNQFEFKTSKEVTKEYKNLNPFRNATNTLGLK